MAFVRNGKEMPEPPQKKLERVEWLSSQAEHDGPKSSGVQLMDYGNDGEIAQPAIL